MTDNSVTSYGWSSATPPHSSGYISPAIIRRLRDLGATRVLDLGAGNGGMCGDLSTAGFDVVGVEHDAQGVEIARATHPSVPFHRHSVEDDPALLLQKERSFDVVISTEVIEHLYAPHKLPQFARAVLKEGGYLIVTTPYHGYLKNLALALTGHWDKHHTALWHGGHIKFFSRGTLADLLRESGFDIVSFSGVGRFRWLWKSMLMVARKRR